MGRQPGGRGRGGPAPRVVHAARSGRGGGGRGEGGRGGASLARGFSRLDPASAAYYDEAATALKSLLADGDTDQATLLAGAALAEAGGREAAAACDAVGSRALEAALAHAPAEAVLAFANVLLATDALADVATRCGREGGACGAGRRGGGASNAPILLPPYSQFGSHTVETLLQRVATLASSTDAAAAPARAALAAATGAASSLWHELAIHRCGSHALRGLACALAGRDVAPRAGAAASGAADGASFLRDAKRAARPGAAVAGLAARAGGGGGAAGAAAFPELVAALAAPLLAPAWADGLADLTRDTYGGPAVQSLIRAAAGDE